MSSADGAWALADPAMRTAPRPMGSVERWSLEILKAKLAPLYGEIRQDAK
jgi:hypothetical protein